MTYETVDAYLDDLDEPAAASLQTLRETIREVLPDAEECISYGVPGYRMDGQVVAGFAAAKRHLSYFPHSDRILPEMADALSDYSWSKGTLRFDIGAELPRPLVERLIAARLALARTT